MNVVVTAGRAADCRTKHHFFGAYGRANVSTVGDRHSLIMLDIDKVNSDYNPVRRAVALKLLSR
jgi:hypothetical protein